MTIAQRAWPSSSEGAIDAGGLWRSAVHAYVQPPPPYGEVAKGIHAILSAKNGGRMSERQADDLIRALLASYMNMVIGYQANGYLERGVSRMVRYYTESWGVSGGRE